MQEQFRNFYEDFASRIQFIRKKRDVTLAGLSGGSASTAKSWESGSRPRPEEWETIARRLGVSVSLLFLGSPKTREDYEFVAKFADEIGQPASSVVVQEVPDIYGEQISPRIIAALKALVDHAAGHPDRLAWIEEQVLKIKAPLHWFVGKVSPSEIMARIVSIPMRDRIPVYRALATREEGELRIKLNEMADSIERTEKAHDELLQNLKSKNP